MLWLLCNKLIYYNYKKMIIVKQMFSEVPLDRPGTPTHLSSPECFTVLGTHNQRKYHKHVWFILKQDKTTLIVGHILSLSLNGNKEHMNTIQWIVCQSFNCNSFLNLNETIYFQGFIILNTQQVFSVLPISCRVNNIPPSCYFGGKMQNILFYGTHGTGRLLTRL